MNYKQLALGLEELNDVLLSNAVVVDPVYFPEYANDQVIDQAYDVFPGSFVREAIARNNREIDQYGTNAVHYDYDERGEICVLKTLSKKNQFKNSFRQDVILAQENMRNYTQYTLFRNVFLLSALFEIQNGDLEEFFENGEPKEHTQTLLSLFDTSNRDTYLPMGDGEYSEAEKTLYKIQNNEQTGLSKKMLEDLERFGVLEKQKVTPAELQAIKERDVAEQIDFAIGLSLADEAEIEHKLTQEEREAAEELDLAISLSLAETDDRDKNLLEEDDDLELLATAQMLPEEELIAQQTLLLAFRQQRGDRAPSPNPYPRPGF